MCDITPWRSLTVCVPFQHQSEDLQIAQVCKAIGAFAVPTRQEYYLSTSLHVDWLYGSAGYRNCRVALNGMRLLALPKLNTRDIISTRQK